MTNFVWNCKSPNLVVVFFIFSFIVGSLGRDALKILPWDIGWV